MLVKGIAMKPCCVLCSRFHCWNIVPIHSAQIALYIHKLCLLSNNLLSNHLLRKFLIVIFVLKSRTTKGPPKTPLKLLIYTAIVSHPLMNIINYGITFSWTQQKRRVLILFYEHILASKRTYMDTSFLERAQLREITLLPENKITFSISVNWVLIVTPALSWFWA